ncbi:hypothetical protein BH10PSE18_BH10PSE18_43520 [soil metagenome]
MASEPHSGQPNGAAGVAADTHIAPWASKWDALPEPTEAPPSSPPPLRMDASNAPSVPADAKSVPPQGVFASKLMAGISAVSFVLLALLIVICWPDLTRMLG